MPKPPRPPLKQPAATRGTLSEPSAQFDLIVIGGGSGGVRAARKAARHARVALIERADLGGTCVNLGCIPKKLLSYASLASKAIDSAADFGWTIEPPHFDWRTLIRNKDREIRRLNGAYDKLLADSGVTLLRGEARFTRTQELRVTSTNGVGTGSTSTGSTSTDGASTTGETLSVRAERILVACGGHPFVPQLEGREHIKTSDQFFHLDALGRRVVVVGGGYIALEFASILNGLGCETSLLYRGPALLRNFDDDIGSEIARALAARGIDVKLNSSLARIDKRMDGLALTLAEGGELMCDQLLYATGRTPNTASLNLQSVGVELDKRGAIIVDDQFRSSCPHIFALGDCARVPNSSKRELTPVAIAEAECFLRQHYLGHADTMMNYDNTATAVFCSPQIASCGLTEKEARARGLNIKCYKTQFRPLHASLGTHDERTLMKLVVNDESGAENGRVIGCHLIDKDAAEIIQGFAVAMNAGATKPTFDATIGLHPTSAEEFTTLPEPQSS